MESILSTLWGQNGNSELGMDIKATWSVQGNKIGSFDTKNKIKGLKGSKKAITPPTPAIPQEVAKGGRLHMDNAINQLEELEMERRSTESSLGLTSSLPFRSTERRQFDWSGLYGMLLDVRAQFKLLKEFLITVEGMREEAESKAISHSPVNMVALIFELLMDKKEEANALREKFNRVLQKLYDDWEAKMSAIDRVLFPVSSSDIDNNNNVKLDVMPYMLVELTEVVRASRIVVFAVRKRYEEARARMTMAIKLKANSDVLDARLQSTPDPKHVGSIPKTKTSLID